MKIIIKCLAIIMILVLSLQISLIKYGEYQDKFVNFIKYHNKIMMHNNLDIDKCTQIFSNIIKRIHQTHGFNSKITIGKFKIDNFDKEILLEKYNEKYNENQNSNNNIMDIKRYYKASEKELFVTVTLLNKIIKDYVIILSEEPSKSKNYKNDNIVTGNTFITIFKME